MAKDPAFLLYSKDWLQGTAQMSKGEKGVYIDLLAHQHQEGGLPTDTKRLARMTHTSIDEFLEIWDYLKEKFVEMDGKLYNRKLESVITGRSDYSAMRSIIGSFGRALKDLKISDAEKEKIRKQFNYKDFIEDFQQNKQNISKTISKWLSGLVIVCPANDGNAIGNGNAIINNKEVSDFVCYDAEDYILKNSRAFEAICMKTGKGSDYVTKELHSYHLWMAKNEKYPVGKRAVEAGVESWVENSEKFKKKYHGLDANQNGASSKGGGVAGSDVIPTNKDYGGGFRRGTN